MKRPAKEILEELYSRQQDQIIEWYCEATLSVDGDPAKTLANFEGKQWIVQTTPSGLRLENCRWITIGQEELNPEWPIWNTIKLLQMIKDGSTDEEVLIAKLEMECHYPL